MSDVTVERPAEVAEAGDGPGIGDAFTLRLDEDGVQQIDCSECGHWYGPAVRDPKLRAVMSEQSIADLSRLNAVGMTERLVARHFYCPSCALLFAVNVQQKGDPIMLEWSILGVAE